MDKELIEEAEKWLGFGERDCLELGTDRILDLMLMVQLEHERLRGFGGNMFWYCTSCDHREDWPPVEEVQCIKCGSTMYPELPPALLSDVRKWTEISMEEVGDYTARELREMVRCGQRRFARLMHGKETGEQSVEN